jgi:hypothetical protein
VSAVFDFDAEGKLTGLRAERYRDLGGGAAALTPFIGRYADYREFGGFRVPASVEVSWVLDEGEFTYARFTVTAIEYNVTDVRGAGASARLSPAVHHHHVS